MKKRILPVIAVIVGSALPALAQEAKAPARKHKVVFELNAPAPSGWDQLFHNVENVQRIFGPEGVQVEAVFFGKGLTMLLKKNDAYAERLKEAADKGVIPGRMSEFDARHESENGRLVPVCRPSGFGLGRVDPEAGSRMVLY